MRQMNFILIISFLCLEDTHRSRKYSTQVVKKLVTMVKNALEHDILRISINTYGAQQLGDCARIHVRRNGIWIVELLPDNFASLERDLATGSDHRKSIDCFPVVWKSGYQERPEIIRCSKSDQIVSSPFRASFELYSLVFTVCFIYSTFQLLVLSLLTARQTLHHLESVDLRLPEPLLLNRE